MKKKYILTLFFAALTLISFSQESIFYKHSISVGGGPSLLGKVIDVVASELEDSIVQINPRVFPVANISYDFFTSQHFSIGASVTFQYMGVKFDDFDYDDNGTTRSADASVAIHRMNYAVRPLFYYTNTYELQVYSGFRIGYLSNKLHIKTDAPGLDEEDFSFKIGARPSFQFIICGIRYYVSDVVGFHSELAVGSPYYCNIGAQFRL